MTDEVCNRRDTFGLERGYNDFFFKLTSEYSFQFFLKVGQKKFINSPHFEAMSRL